MKFMPEKQAALGEGSLLGRVPVLNCGASVKYPVGYRSFYKDSGGDDGKIPAVGPLVVGVAGVFLYLKSPSSLKVGLFAGNLGINHQS